MIFTLDFLQQKKAPHKLQDIVLKLGDISKEDLIKHLANNNEFELLYWVVNVKPLKRHCRNLIVIDSEKAKAIGSIGGIASGVAKRQKKTIKLALECLDEYINKKDKQYTDDENELSFIDNCPPEIRLFASVLLNPIAEIKDKIRVAELIANYKYGKPLQQQETRNININAISITELLSSRLSNVVDVD